MAVSDGPFEVLVVPRRYLGFFAILGRRLVSFFFIFLSLSLLRNLFNFNFLNNDLLQHVISDIENIRFFLVLEADNAHDFADLLRDLEELVHESQLEALLIRLKLVRVA